MRGRIVVEEDGRGQSAPLDAKLGLEACWVGAAERLSGRLIVRDAGERNESIGPVVERLKVIGEVGSRLAESAWPD